MLSIQSFILFEIAIITPFENQDDALLAPALPKPLFVLPTELLDELDLLDDEELDTLLELLLEPPERLLLRAVEEPPRSSFFSCGGAMS
jgi:hypothetical protein